MGSVVGSGLWHESQQRLIVNKYQYSEVINAHIYTRLVVGVVEAAMIQTSNSKLSYDKMAAVRGIPSQISLVVQSIVVFEKDED